MSNHVQDISFRINGLLVRVSNLKGVNDMSKPTSSITWAKDLPPIGASTSRGDKWVQKEADLINVGSGSPLYSIPLDRLLEVQEGRTAWYSWPLHMCEKEWVTPSIFCRAWYDIASTIDGFDHEKASKTLLRVMKECRLNRLPV